MVKIFQPLLKTALIYIDDILSFSENKDIHDLLIQRFTEIVTEHGIMLSKKKMIIAVFEIDFLGMHIKNGNYSLQPHIAEELLKFPNENLTKQQVQQFLGAINYMTNFFKQLTPIIRPLQEMLKKNPPQWSPR
ncbi:uncharacterized protein LOC111376123 [Olea europaea var. sylvestris]|uniref:uncharacterized protein LOC111376123 n=1 Tax=Olea europaea var. sylvestris TaxID=158386 RepID=UPI000C1CDE52|nr:uncharacterized protein LOC111376123 [Olea europaea var. sylvestris]